MKKQYGIIIPSVALIAVIIFIVSCAGEFTFPDTEITLEGSLEYVVETYAIPALAGAIIYSDGVQCKVEGVRVMDESDAVTLTDKWQLGGNTMAMTASLIAILVEDGLLTWNTTTLDVFPELTDSISEDLKSVTITQLLTHRAGIQPYTTQDELDAIPDYTGTPSQQRRSFAAYILNQDPYSEIDSYAFSNAGYSIAAAMAEKVCGDSWETLMQTKLFGPLDLEVSYGWPAHDDSYQPWGHWNPGSGLEPHDPDDEYQIPTVILPANGVCMSIGDYAKFIQWHLRGLLGTENILTQTSFEKLHTAVGGYAMGWASETFDEIESDVHDGSAGTFYAVTVIQVSEDRALVVIANSYCYTSVAAVSKVMDYIVDLW